MIKTKLLANLPHSYIMSVVSKHNFMCSVPSQTRSATNDHRKEICHHT